MMKRYPLYRLLSSTQRCQGYVRALEYALENLPLKDDLLKNASFVSYKTRDDASFSQVEYFVDRFVTCTRTRECRFTLSLSHSHSYTNTLMHVYLKLNFHRFGTLLPYESPQKLDLLSEEFTEYQLLQDADIPQDIWDKATVAVEEGQAYHRMDVLWHYLSSLRAADNSF